MSLAQLFMNANHIAQGGSAGSFEPQRSNQGLLIIYGLDLFGSAFTRGPIGNVLTLAIRSFPIPTREVGVIAVPYLNQDRKVAGSANVPELEVTIADYIDQPAHVTLSNWFNAVCDPFTGRVGLARDYKKTAEAILLGPNGQYDRRYVLNGVFPSRFQPGSIDYGSQEQSMMQMTLQCDTFAPVQSTGWGFAHQYPLEGISYSTALNAALGAATQVGLNGIGNISI